MNWSRFIENNFLLSFSEYNVPRDSIFIGIQISTHFRARRCKCAVFLTSKTIHEQSRIQFLK